MDEQQEFTTQQLLPQEPTDQFQQQQDIVNIPNPLQSEFELAKSNFSEQIMQTIKALMKYREKRTYHLFVSDKTDYFSSMWLYLQKKMNNESQHLQTDLLEAISIRQSNIIYDIMDHRLKIEQNQARKYQEQLKSKKVSMLKQQQSQIQRKLMDINEEISEIKHNQQKISQSHLRPFEINEAKLKEYEEFVKKQKKEKEERAKMIEEQKKKEEEIKIKKQQDEREAREKALQQKKEELLKQMKEKEEKRKRQRQERQQRNKQYKIISKSLAEQPPLFKKLQKSYYSRYAQEQNEKRQKILSERHSMIHHDIKAIEQHQKKYQQLRSEREMQRKERMQELQKMMELQQQEIHSKYKSNYEFKKEVIDPRVEEKKLALQKKEKVKRYIQETVKQRYLPRIDEEKRKEFLRLIEDMNKKKVKKVVREDGSVQYEELKPSDPRMVGLQYLQKTKQMAAKARARRKSSDQIPETQQQQQSKVFDYLGQRRKKGTSMSNRDRYGFVSRKGLSFDQKVKKVQLQSQKLEELAKQKQMKLKYGKFTTSEEILQHKQQIDQHYMDIISMKLKLINTKD